MMTRQRTTAQYTTILQIASGSWPLLGGPVGVHTLMPLIAGHRAADHKKEFMRKKNQDAGRERGYYNTMHFEQVYLDCAVQQTWHAVFCGRGMGTRG